MPKKTAKKTTKKTVKKETNDVKVIKEYTVEADEVSAKVTITRGKRDYVPTYHLSFPQAKAATEAIIVAVKGKVIHSVNITSSELLDSKMAEKVKQKLFNKTSSIIDELLPGIDPKTKKSMVGSIVHEMFGLGEVELLLNDDNIEEIVINNSNDCVWVYHKNGGWMKSNITLDDEKKIHNYASVIGRRVGKQISNLDPLMDAHLLTGDRVNATLFPISSKGNTITIRKFARNPWTITDFMDPKLGTLSKEVAAFLWLCIQYELNIIVGGGTASGKTSLLNALTPFLAPSHRIITIEDTRELQLPNFAHWVPLTTRQPNPEGKGEVDMLDLMVNSLRMRPDRIFVGEVRKKAQAEVMLEAMHTGHSVYSTFHANSVDEMYSRLINPPISMPKSQVDAIDLAVIQFRHRRLGIRRTYQIAELISKVKGDERSVETNLLYRWNAKNDKVERVGTSKRVYKQISEYTGMSSAAIEKDLKEKQEILQWMVDNNVKSVNAVGKVIADYYLDKDSVIRAVRKKVKPAAFFPKAIVEELRRYGYID